MTIWKGPHGYWVSDETARIDVERVHRWLSTQSYWARGRPPEVTRRAISRSLNLALFEAGGSQVGFCRWVTDGATFAWLCDVFVEPAQRGHGGGVFLVQVATEHPEVRGLRFLLGTKDAHGLYAKFGFGPPVHPERMMEIKPDTPPQPSP